MIAVEIISAKVMTRKENDRNENFSPSVSSPYTLTVNENSALIQSHDGPDKNRYERLLRIPTKPMSELRTIKSILDVIETMQNQYVSLLVVVTFVSFATFIFSCGSKHFQNIHDFSVISFDYDNDYNFPISIILFFLHIPECSIYWIHWQLIRIQRLWWSYFIQNFESHFYQILTIIFDNKNLWKIGLFGTQRQ